MNEENLEMGFFKVFRSLFESEIWFRAPEYAKIWIYLLGKANHEARHYRGHFCDRGQYFCNYKELQKQLIHRKKKNYESTVKNIMKYLDENQMIEKVKDTRGMLITILKYDEYQDKKNHQKTDSNGELIINEENLEKGFFKVFRSLFESKVWFMAPEYAKIWIYLLGKACHAPKTYRDQFCDRGQYLCNYRELQDQLIHSKRSDYKSAVNNIMTYLEKNQMIEKVQPTQDMLITILNYNKYQGKKDHQKTDIKPTANQNTLSINKNYKELKELKNIYEVAEKKNNNFKRELNDEELKLIDDFIDWVYDEDNKFYVKTPIDVSRDYFKNLLLKYGFEKISEIFYEFEEKDTYESYIEEGISLVTGLWNSMKELKYE